MKTINRRMTPLLIILLFTITILIGCNAQPQTTVVPGPSPVVTVTSVNPTITESLPVTQEVDLTQTVESSQNDGAIDDYSAVDPSGQVITFWHPFKGVYESALISLISEFNNSNPWGILVKQSYQGSSYDIHNRMLTFLNTGEGPSVLVATGTQAAAYQLGDALVDINNLMNHQTWGLSEADILDIYPGLVQQGIFPSYNHHRLTYPLFGRMNVLYYNLDWLAEMGFDVSPESPEGFLEAACIAAGQPFSGSTAAGRMGFQLNTNPDSFLDWSLAFGGKLFDFGTNQYQLESDSVYNAMSFLQSLIKRGCGSTESTTAAPSPGEGAMIDFSRGVLLFAVDSTDKIPEFRHSIQSEANFNWRISPLPHTTTNPINNVQGVNASIPKTDPKQELAAWLFLKFFTSPENQAKWVRETNTLPIRSSAVEFLSDYFSTSPAAQMTLEMLTTSTHEPSVPGYSRVQILCQETLSVILGGADITTELSKLSSDANSLLEDQMVLIPESTDPWTEVDPSGQTIQFWHQQDQARSSVMEEIINEFNAKNKWGITVVPVAHQNYGEIFQKLLPVFGTEEVPSMVLAYQHHAAAYHEAGGLIDINSLLNSTKWGLPPQDSEDIFQTILEQDIFQIFDSSRLGFPLQRSTDILYYNADWLVDLGYQSPPKNPDEFKEMACAAATFGGPTDGGIGYQFYVDATRFSSWVFAFGGKVFDDSQFKYYLNGPGTNSVIQFLQELFESGCAAPITDRLIAQTAFSEGSLLFMVDSSFHIPTIADFVSSNADFNWAVAPLPSLSVTPVQNLFGASLSIPKSRPEKELAAWLFIKYLAEPQVQAIWGMDAGYLPIRRGARDFLNDFFQEFPLYQASFDLLQYGVTEPSLPGYDFVHQELELALQAIFLPEDVEEDEEINVVEILDSLNATANQILITHLER